MEEGKKVVKEHHLFADIYKIKMLKSKEIKEKTEESILLENSLDKKKKVRYNQVKRNVNAYTK